MLPDKISATNIELLIRNPYGFYAKYVLGLRRLENLYDQTSLSQFGNFIHKVIEDYTNQYDVKYPNKKLQILEIGNQILQTEYSNNILANLYWPKFQALANEFIEFDENRRAMGASVFSERYGEIQIPLKNKTVSITAIADRIDLFANNTIHILDYKTGSIPTKADIMSGISVQLIIEAMIANNNGFQGIKGNVSELTYVKFTPSSPYVKTTSFKISDFDLDSHMNGLKKILSFYDEGGEYLINTSPSYSPKYDDYKHLERKD